MAEETEKVVESRPPPTTELIATEATPSQEEKLQPPSPPAEEPKSPTEEKPKDVEADEQKALVLVSAPDEKVEESPEKKKKPEGGSIDRDAVLERVETEKRMSLIRAWEDNEKCRTENKAEKKLSSVDTWEHSRKASIEAQLKAYEEMMEKKNAEYAEKMKNKISLIHREAEERKAMIVYKKGEELLKVEEMAAKYRATGKTPEKMFGCF